MHVWSWHARNVKLLIAHHIVAYKQTFPNLAVGGKTCASWSWRPLEPVLLNSVFDIHGNNTVILQINGIQTK